MVKPKVQARSSRAVAEAVGFGSGAFPGSIFGTASSALSYLSELPDVVAISDANTVVAFKNLFKKDSTTKARALEELQATLFPKDPKPPSVEDAVVEAWVGIYPRTSIDASRRVRQLAHTLQGEITATAGKRMAKYMPKVVGPWLLGLYDNDKVVSSAARAALQQVFSTAEKLQALRKAYQEPLLEIFQTIIDKESPQTLSDERSVSPDEANAKYYRVLAAALGLISSLVSGLHEDDMKRFVQHYQELFQNKKLWSLTSTEDPSVRRATHRLLRTCIERSHVATLLDLDQISSSFIEKGLEADQKGSALEFVETLLLLSKVSPSVFTDHWKSKKSPSTRLRHFVRKGSQGAAAQFWAKVATVFASIPDSTLPSEPEDAEQLLESFNRGVTRKDEPRPHLITGLESYIQVAHILAAHVAESNRLALLKATVLPIIKSFILPSEDSIWNISSPAFGDVVPRAVQIRNMETIIDEEWPAISGNIIEDIKISLPEQSKDHTASQDRLGQKGARWATVLAVILGAAHQSSSVLDSSFQVIECALEVCKSRNGKPFGATYVVAHALRKCPSILLQSGSESLSTVKSFLEKDLPSLILSPSTLPLISILSSTQDLSIFPTVWEATLDTVLDASESPKQLLAFKQLLALLPTSKHDEFLRSNAKVRQFLKAQLDRSSSGQAGWEFIGEILKQSKDDALNDDVLSSMISSLANISEAQHTLGGFQYFAKSTPREIERFIGTAQGREFLAKILTLTESADDEIAHTALDLNSLIHTLLSKPSTTEYPSQNSIIEVIQAGLNTASSDSISVETLLGQAKDLLSSKVSHFDALLPQVSVWRAELDKFLQNAPDLALTITSPLNGLLFCLEISDGKESSIESQPSRDGQGFSIPLRMAIYTAELLKIYDSPVEIENGVAPEIFQLLVLTLNLANDNLGLVDCNKIWWPHGPLAENEMIEFISTSQTLITSYLTQSRELWEDDTLETPYSFIIESIRTFFNSSQGTSVKAYHNALAYCVLVRELIELHGWPNSRKSTGLDQLMESRRLKDFIQSMAFISSHNKPLAEVPTMARWYNELLADLTGLDFSQPNDTALQKLNLLDAITNGQEDTFIDKAAHQRRVFFVRHVVRSLVEKSITPEVQTMIFQILTRLVPYLSTIYGDHWESLSSYICKIWTEAKDLDTRPDSNTLSLVYASLRLYFALKRMTSDEECNEDLIEAFQSTAEWTYRGAFNLLSLERTHSDQFHQPLRIVNELISRVVADMPPKYFPEPESTYPLMSSNCAIVQMAAFKLLHRMIPLRQGELSLDFALEKKAAHMPHELLSLILEAPGKNDYDDADFQQTIPLGLQSYLLSWVLVFDHFNNASFQLKGLYVDDIKTGDYTSGLLNITFTLLGHSKGKPVDASRFDVTSYELDSANSPLQDLQWLLSHLYYLSLVNLSSITKAWWMECKSRLTVQTVESWTAKYISPGIITNAMLSVRSWTEETANSSPETDGAALTIDINTQTSELIASYPIGDDSGTRSTLAILISLPPTFPLHQAVVSSRSDQRTAIIDDRRWQAWLRAAQGVIAFGNNSIVDGLLAWRRNIVGTLQGKSECTICYSLVGEDGKLPARKCRTCKNEFHMLCLTKWFASSGNRHCPLCRSDFAGFGR